MNTKTMMMGAVLALTLSACSDYGEDINNLTSRVNNLENRVSALESWQTTANSEISSLKALTNALTQRNYVVSVVESADAYRLTLGDGTIVPIPKQTTEQSVGEVPVIGVRQDSDGNYYWTLNGEWLTDETGGKVRANGQDGKDGKDGADGKDGKDGADGKDGKDGVDSKNGVDGKDGKDGVDGKDGITPLIRINRDTYNWEVSYDNGETWTELKDADGNPFTAKGIDGKDGKDGEPGQPGQPGAPGQPGTPGQPDTSDGTGDSFFKGAPVVDKEKGTVAFILADGTEFVLPYYESVNDVRDRLQSLVYMPDYTDGLLTLPDEEATVSLSYMVRPAAIANFMANNKEKLSFIVLDGLTTTRAISTSASLVISEVKAQTSGDNGILTVTATAKGFAADGGYAVALSFGDGTSDYTTVYTPVWVKMAKPTATIVAEDGTPSGSTVAAGGGLQLLSVIGKGDAVRNWSTDNKLVGIIDGDGWLTLLAEGEVTVTLSTIQGATANYVLKVSAGAVKVDKGGDGVDQDKAEARGK